MAIHGQTTSVDELLDQAGDAVARNDWGRANTRRGSPPTDSSSSRSGAHSPNRHAYLETERAPDDPLSSSRDLRFMSIMFCDVVSSTQLARELGDALWRNTLERFRRRCARAVRRYDGYIHEASGDELLILFGYPRVREDDARRAVLAGLDIVAAIQSFSALLEREHRLTSTSGSAYTPAERYQGAQPRGPVSSWRRGNRRRARRRSREHRETHRDRGEAEHRVGQRATRRIVEGFFEFATAPDGERELEFRPATSHIR